LKRAVEDFYLVPFATQVGTDIEKTQRRIGLHDLKLLGILVEEISMCE
jgi:hypothetical protein